MLLENVRIGTPCNARWSAMEGDARVRFCGECGKNVYNLSALPRAEAERLLEEREGRICIRLYKRADGTVMTADCPVGLRRLRVRRVMALVAGVAGVAALEAAAFATAWRHNAPLPEQETVVAAVADVVPIAVSPEPSRPGVEQLPELAPPPPPPKPTALAIAVSKRRRPRPAMMMGGF
jgi:hypothetical protein